MSSTQTTTSGQCAGCAHLYHPDGGHCYMFKTEPDRCGINTSTRVRLPGRIVSGRSRIAADLMAALALSSLAIDAEVIAAGMPPSRRSTAHESTPGPDSRTWPRERAGVRGKAARKAAKRTKREASNAQA